MTRILDRQVEAFGRHEGDDAAAVPADRASVESAIDVGVSLFDAAKNEVRRWQRKVTDWDSPQTIAQAREYDRVYRSLHEALNRLLPAAAKLEGAGEAPENINRLRTALQELDGIVCFDLDRVVRADRAVRTGAPTRTSAEVTDALRRRVGG